MIIFKNIFRIIWRIWFYGLMLFTIIGVFPILLIITANDKFYPIFFKIARAWAKTILFVGKKELAKIPIFGFFYKRTCILVDRNNALSRKKVYRSAQERLRKGISICIFPEGKVPDDESIVLDKFQNGAFHLAIEHQIPIVPLIFYDCKKRFSYTFFSGQPGKLSVKINNFIQTKGLKISDKNKIKQYAHQLIYNELITNQATSKTTKTVLNPKLITVKTKDNIE